MWVLAGYPLMFLPLFLCSVVQNWDVDWEHRDLWDHWEHWAVVREHWELWEHWEPAMCSTAATKSPAIQIPCNICSDEPVALKTQRQETRIGRKL